MHYSVQEVTNIQMVRQLFPNGIADEANWIFCSTGGIHGSDKTLDDVEYILRGEDPKNPPLPNGKWYITVLIVFPKTCSMLFGEIMVNQEDIDYLRRLVRSSVEAVRRSQGGNL